MKPTIPSGNAGRTNGLAQAITNGPTLAADSVFGERVRQERQRLIEERQVEVGRVLERHDDLVREAFHLDHFVSFLSFDPEVAKADKSAVFLQYRARYDLVNNAPAGPSRTTRRAHNERLHALQATSSSAPPQSKTKSTVLADADSSKLWDLLAEVKPGHKGKRRADPQTSESVSAAPSPAKKIRGKAALQAHVGTTESLAGPREVLSTQMNRQPTAVDSPRGRPRKKRKVDHEAPSTAPPPGHHDNNSTMARQLVTTNSLSTPARTRKSERNQPVAPPLETVDDDDFLASNNHLGSPFTPLRRIKLIVRRPQPSFSDPRQKPPSPKFGSSMTAFLESYVAPDHKDLDEDALRRRVKADLDIWRRYDRMRRQGKMLYRPPDPTLATEVEGEMLQRQPDAWDGIIEAVKLRAQTPMVSGQQIAAQIAACVRAYWEAQAIRDDKVRVQEEKRLRALAKATIRMVAAEWKKAVFHIRERERSQREAEERRRGHAHLEALLDQSGQILEAQHVDLTKNENVSSRSRSSSLAATLHHWASSPSLEEEGDQVQRFGDGAADSDEGDTASEDSSASDEELHASSFALVFPVPSPKSLAEDTDATSSARRTPSDDGRDEDIPLTRAVLDGVFTGSPDPDPPVSPTTESSRDYDGRPLEDDEDDDGMLASTSPTARTFQATKGTEPIVKSRLPYDPVSESGPIPRSSTPLEFANDGHRPPLHGKQNGFANAAHIHIEATPADDSPEPATGLMPQLTILDTSLSDEPIHGAPLQSQQPSTTNDAQEVTRADGDRTPGGADDEDSEEDEVEADSTIPRYLRPYAVAPVEWDLQTKVKPPLLLRGTLRPYQHAGLEWLASLHTNNVNGILADEMGLGKTIQTISLLAHLACDRGIWGPHLIIVPTSVLLNWEMEFKKFLPGFKVLSYHGNSKRRKELRQGWNNKYHFNVCVTSYTLASRDAHVFKRKPWYYMILDEAHMIKNFKSQRWNLLLMFRSFRRLLLTGTPLQNNLTELWALLQFLMSGTDFANLKEFGEWFANPLEKAIEMGTVLDDQTQQRVAKLHNVLRPYLLRRLKRDVEKELPSKFEHLVMCPLSKRQRFLYDEFMSRADTRHDLQSGVYQKIANILMQLRKVVNHPDLFEVRPIRTSFAMPKSAVADYEIKELLVRRELLREDEGNKLNLDILGLRFIDRQGSSVIVAHQTHFLDGTSRLPHIIMEDDPPPADTRTIAGFRAHKAYMERAAEAARWAQIAYLNRLRCNKYPVIDSEVIRKVAEFCKPPLLPLSAVDQRVGVFDRVARVHLAIKSYQERTDDMAGFVDRFSFATPAVVARDLPVQALAGFTDSVARLALETEFDAILHRSSVKLQIAFPDPSLLQYDCGKLQELARLLRERKAGGHRILIFTQMTRILDILEIFLNLHGYLYLRLDGATKIEDRQYITERFNTDPRIFCFISSSRSGGVGINLTGADTVIFYDSDFNPQMDRQCEDRAHRIGQIRDVHIYRFISTHTIEEALLRKANQKRSLDDIVIQKGEFDWRTLFGDDGTGVAAAVGGGDQLNVSALERALGEFEDTEDRRALEVATREEVALVGADEADFGAEGGGEKAPSGAESPVEVEATNQQIPADQDQQERDETIQDEEGDAAEEEEEDDEEGGTAVDYMLSFAQRDWEFFSEWKV